jgi:hypothetical protein
LFWCVRCGTEVAIPPTAQGPPDRCPRDLGGCGRSTSGEDSTILVDLSEHKRARAEDWYNIVCPQFTATDGGRRPLSDILEHLQLGGDNPSRARFTKSYVESLIAEFPPDSATDAPSNEWEISKSRRIRWTPQGIDLIVKHGDHEEDIPVVFGYVRPLQQVDLDGDNFFKVKLDREIIVTAEALRKRLDREAKTVAHGHANDVLNHVLLHFAPTPMKAHATFGVYEDEGGKLDLCTDPMAPLQEEGTALREMREAIACEPRPEDLAAYMELATLFHPYEVYPTMALSAIAPFAMRLRAHDVIVPHVYNHSLESGLGKSFVLECFSERLYGRKSVPGDTLDSPYRFGAFIDSACTPLWIEEGEKLDYRKLGATLKSASEREIALQRGTQDLGMTTYRSRAVLMITGNAFPVKSGSVLARFIAPKFDAMQRTRRKTNKRKADELRAQLRPIGVALAREAVAAYGTMADLVARIHVLETEVTRAYRGTFQDVRRPQAWAVVLMGLRMWELLFRKHGIVWAPPSVEAFLRDVVLPVEASTYEGAESHLESFRSFFAMWRVKNRIVRSGGIEDIRGEGEIWKQDTADVADVQIPGVWVTKPILDEYNRQALPDMQISSLKSLGQMAADTWAIPRKIVLDKDGEEAKVERFDKKTERAVFVPEGAPAPEEEVQRTLEEDLRARESRGQKGCNSVSSDPPNGETLVTQECNMLRNIVTPSSSMETSGCYAVTPKMASVQETQTQSERESQDPLVEESLRLVNDLRMQDKKLPPGLALSQVKDMMARNGHPLAAEQIAACRVRLELPPKEAEELQGGSS